MHAAEKRLSGHLGSRHWDATPLAEGLLRRAARWVGRDSLLVVDLTDLAKPYARVLEGLGRVRDGSDPARRVVRGYAVFEAYVRVGRWQLFPLVVEPMRAYAGRTLSENHEILLQIDRIRAVVGEAGIWVMDRGGDRRELLVPLLKRRAGFIIRQVGDRHVWTRQGECLRVRELADRLRPGPEAWRGDRGVTVGEAVRLPAAPREELLLVAHWSRAEGSPLMLLVSPAARRPGRRGSWFVKAYRRRWGVEDAARGLKQHFRIEAFLVRKWHALQRLLWLVALAFYWLNLWGQERYAPLREALLRHPWRLPKQTTYLFNPLATQIRYLLHPRPPCLIQME